MTEQLTSVRFHREAIDQLKQLAELHDGSVAAEIRQAVANYIASCSSAPDFSQQVEAKRREREQSTEEFAVGLLELAGSPGKRR